MGKKIILDAKRLQYEVKRAWILSVQLYLVFIAYHMQYLSMSEGNLGKMSDYRGGKGRSVGWGDPGYLAYKTKSKKGS
jgi:hypothetical protein